MKKERGGGCETSFAVARMGALRRSADFQSAVSPRVSGCDERRLHFGAMFMGVKWHFEGVTDLNCVGPQRVGWPLSCCHELRPIYSLPAAGFYSPRAVPSLCRSLWRRLQDQTLHYLAAICLSGFRAIDLTPNWKFIRICPRKYWSAWPNFRKSSGSIN